MVVVCWLGVVLVGAAPFLLGGSWARWTPSSTPWPALRPPGPQRSLRKSSHLPCCSGAASVSGSGYRHHRAVRGHRTAGRVRRHPALLGRGGDPVAGADHPAHSGHGQGAGLRLRRPYAGGRRRPAPGRDGNVRRGQLRSQHGLDRRVLYRLQLRGSLRLLGRRAGDHGWDGVGWHELRHLLYSGPARIGTCRRQRRARHLPRGDPREHADNRRSCVSDYGDSLP